MGAAEGENRPYPSPLNLKGMLFYFRRRGGALLYDSSRAFKGEKISGFQE